MILQRLYNLCSPDWFRAIFLFGFDSFCEAESRGCTDSTSPVIRYRPFSNCLTEHTKHHTKMKSYLAVQKKRLVIICSLWKNNQSFDETTSIKIPLILLSFLSQLFRKCSREYDLSHASKRLRCRLCVKHLALGFIINILLSYFYRSI